MGLEEKATATAKNVEGKVQETAGNVTGDPEDRVEGKAKQAEAEAHSFSPCTNTIFLSI
jgi:uncharacterized protein YjbJ (UPF0337 family)